MRQPKRIEPGAPARGGARWPAWAVPAATIAAASAIAIAAWQRWARDEDALDERTRVRLAHGRASPPSAADIVVG